MTPRLFVWATIVVMVSAAGIKGSQAGLLDPVQSGLLQPLAPVQAGLHDFARPVADFLSNITRYNDIRRENQRLSAENERLRSQLAEAQETQHEADELQALLDVKRSYPEERFVAARVIGREPNRLRHVIAIDRGSDDGIQEGMVVVGKQHSLVGRVTKVYGDYAFVRLITDHESRVTAMVQGSRATGMVSGSPEGELALDWVPHETTVNVNDTVVTSSLGGNFPDALLIGRISSAESNPAHQFQTIKVQPAVDFSSLEFVLVLTSFLPRPLGGG